MKGRLLDLSFTLNGKQRLVIELDDDFRQDFAALEDHDVRVESRTLHGCVD